MDFGQPNAKIGQKMASGQLLFLALYIPMLGTGKLLLVDRGSAVLLVSTDQRRLDWSHKAAEEGESTRACPVSTAYSPVVRRSSPTEEDGQPLPTVAHAKVDSNISPSVQMVESWRSHAESSLIEQPLMHYSAIKF